MEDTGTDTQESLETGINTQGQKIEYVAVGDNTVSIKNVGFSPLSEVTVLIEGEPVTATSPGTVNPGEVGAFTLDSAELHSKPFDGELTIISGGNTLKPKKTFFSQSSITGYWKFDDLTQGRTIKDYSGNGLDGTI